MDLEQLEQVYATRGYAALRASTPTEPLAHFYPALVAFGQGDLPAAAQAAQQAAEHAPNEALFIEAARYLRRVEREGLQQVYISGEAFTAFITGGGNVPLYAETSAALRSIYQEYTALRLLDSGVGNGHALLPALVPAVAHVDLVEPSAALLGELTAQLDQQGTPYSAFNGTLQAFVAQSEATWLLAQSTYSFHSIPPEERPALFTWLRQHTKRLLIVEFDVPRFAGMYSAAHVRSVVERYRRGLAEYREQPLVAQGFLMPVFFGYFDRSVMRTTYEQPIAEWRDSLHAAGFRTTLREIYPYWWASAYLIDAE